MLRLSLDYKSYHEVDVGSTKTTEFDCRKGWQHFLTVREGASEVTDQWSQVEG